MALKTSSYSSRQYIEDALSCTTSSGSSPIFALSYEDPTQKRIIQEHLISLFQDFPSLKPSIDAFTHNDGATVTLLNVSGEIHVFSPAVSSGAAAPPPIFLTIWLNENYPSMAPLVYVSPFHCSFSIYSDHPFVDSSSGAATSSYLVNWNPGCNLSELVRNLVKVFSHFHPFYYSPSAPFDPCFVSKREALDRLACNLHYDMIVLGSKTEHEIDELSAIQSELEKRGDIVRNILYGLENEREKLKERVKELTDEADVLLNWLKVSDVGGGVVAEDVDDAFEAVDQKSRVAMECEAGDKVMEDSMYALDEAVEKGFFSSFGLYIKQVRSLARTQFEFRAKQIKFLQLPEPN